MPLYPIDLNHYIKLENPVLSTNDILNYSKQILLGINHLHRHGVLHRDVKPSNVLIGFVLSILYFFITSLDKKGGLVLCDFSLASNFVTKMQHSITVQTLWYRSIEILLGCTTYNIKIDIWSFGCVLAFMVFYFIIFSFF